MARVFIQQRGLMFVVANSLFFQPKIKLTVVQYSHQVLPIMRMGG